MFTNYPQFDSERSYWRNTSIANQLEIHVYRYMILLDSDIEHNKFSQTPNLMEVMVPNIKYDCGPRLTPSDFNYEHLDSTESKVLT